MPDEIRDQLKPKAIDLRRQGWTYREIAGSLNISISTCSLWLRDVPAPRRPGHEQERVAAMWKERWEPLHVAREEERRKVKLAACREVGRLSDRDVLMTGALVYWCEGQKDKIYRRVERVSFINSDPALIVLFMRFLRTAGVSRERLRFRLHIHETADLDAASEWWAELVGCPAEAFQKPVIKRHNPKTVRKNLVDAYRGCLQISVTKSADLYRRIEGWAYGAMLGGEAAETRLISRSDEALGRLLAERAQPRQ
ncbi:helix-turn-helix domain-containing protein [Spirillospora sp. NPDC048832]